MAWRAAVCAVAVLLLVGCAASVPDSAEGIIELVEDAGLVDCSERRTPVPDVITCEDEEAGDITVGLTTTAEDTVRSTAATSDGPWIAGDSFVVITYDGDVDRARAIRDAIGTGEVLTVDGAGEPEPIR